MTPVPAPTAVVVGCDDSWQSRAAVKVATREAGRRHCPLILLCIARSEGWRGGLAALRTAEQDALGAATATAKRAAELATATDHTVPVESVIAESVDTPKVSEVARSAELLVVGGYGSRGQTAFSLGTTSGELVRRFAAPVLVPPRASEAGSARRVARQPEVFVGVGLPSSEVPRSGPEPQSVLRTAAAQAALRGWPLTVVHVVPQGGPGQLHLQQEAVWEAVHAVPECSSVPCRVDMLQGAVTSALVRRVGPGDLLVVGTRGGGTLAGLIEGSVARGVLDTAVCEVMVVPAASDTGPRRATTSRLETVSADRHE